MATCVASCFLSLLAVQMEHRTFVSPVTNKPFGATYLPGQTRSGGVQVDADMGVDTDGCVHTSGVSEYQYAVLVDPTSYFTALAIEWGEDGMFRNQLQPAFIDWLRGPDGLSGQLDLDNNRLFDLARRKAAVQGQPKPNRANWLIPQEALSPEKKYQFALQCYRRRDVENAFLARIATSGAWAIRCLMNVPMMSPELAGGVDEVNLRLAKFIEDGEEFKLDKITEAYGEIFKSRNLTNEGYFVAGMTYLGFVLRQGDLQRCGEIIETMFERFDDETKHKFFRGLLRERRRMIMSEYRAMLEVACVHWILALREEEIPRAQMPLIVYNVGEFQWRRGQKAEAYNWFLAFSKMEETQPSVRAEVRARGGKALNDQAPPLVRLGWQADERLEAFRLELQIDEGQTIAGPHANLLNDIVFRGLGTLEFVGNWQARTGGSVGELQEIMKQAYESLLTFNARFQAWPRELGVLWQVGLVRSRNRVNRFHCPVTGAPLLYEAPANGQLVSKAVLIATSEPVLLQGQAQYLYFVGNNLSIQRSTKRFLPSEIFTDELR
jgi:hypothetical protein